MSLEIYSKSVCFGNDIKYECIASKVKMFSEEAGGSKGFHVRVMVNTFVQRVAAAYLFIALLHNALPESAWSYYLAYNVIQRLVCIYVTTINYWKLCYYIIYSLMTAIQWNAAGSTQMRWSPPHRHRKLMVLSGALINMRDYPGVKTGTHAKLWKMLELLHIQELRKIHCRRLMSRIKTEQDKVRCPFFFGIASFDTIVIVMCLAWRVSMAGWSALSVETCITSWITWLYTVTTKWIIGEV